MSIPTVQHRQRRHRWRPARHPAAGNWRPRLAHDHWQGAAVCRWPACGGNPILEHL